MVKLKKIKEKPTGILSMSDLKTFKGKSIHWIFVAILVVFSLVSLVPSLWMIMVAFKDPQEIYTSLSFFPKDMTFEKMIGRITESWEILKLGETILLTIFKSLGDLVFTLVFCGFSGYALSKIKPKGTKVIFALVVWTMMMPSQVRTVPNYMTMLHFPFAYDWGGVNLLNTYWPLWIGHAVQSFTIILFKNSFDAIPTTLVEAAEIDGCSKLGIFFKIMLPLSMPIVLYVSITSLQQAWTDYFGPLIYLTDNYTLPLKLFKMSEASNVKMNTYFMGFIFASIPSLIIFLVGQKYILGGVNIGGVKG